jgi:ABC-type dipeptide/oligopeptide/nickel transport system ATPase subunit
VRIVSMSDRSETTVPTPETPGSDNDSANGATTPPTHGETPAPGDPSAASDTPALHATAETPPNDTPAPPADSNATPPTAAADDDTIALATEPTPAGGDETQAQPAYPATEPGTALGGTADRPGQPASGPLHREPLEHTAILERPNGTPFLTAQGLTAAGRQGPIFTDISFTASLGQIVALCGDGGEGRSSLLLALTGRFPFRSGALEVDGQTRAGHIRRRFTIAQAGPPIRFDPYATVRTCINETVTVSKGAATRANISAWLDRLAVNVDTGDAFGFLPRIDQIRFAIACAAASRTPAIAVDDVDTGLDTAGSERVFDTLRTVADAGQLVLVACTRSDPPADTVVDLRAQPQPTASALHGRDRNGGLR